ncbi:MAG: S41 family peptidase [Sulfobacillus acidophilus]|uniref:S41 family peptidase n=1 Tax=Sulfobacillus acidophilus TaxID=53633 RepID=A0A2T2WMK2_9FIRM|nr:MAG: S41 family peptidase [Sulfobacillus acidophilus]
MGVRRLGAWMALTVLLMAASSGATWWFARQATRSAVAGIPVSMVDNAQFQRLVSTYQLIRSRSIWHNTPQQLLAGATDGMVSTLHDPFTNYLTRTETRNLEDELAPSYVGVGVSVTMTRPLVIDQVFAGTPAQQAGLKVNEVIVRVNGHRTAAMNPNAALQMLRGKTIGSTVTVTVKAGSTERQVTLTRRRIFLPTVHSRMLADHVAYLDIQVFGQNTRAEAMAQFHRLMRQHPRGMVLDLRDNPGGEVTQAVAVARLFVPKGPVVTLKYKNAHHDITYNSAGPGTRLPVVVLINHQTASAAEILAAAIAERQGGKLVGTRSYGKGIVQQVVPLSDGTSLKLTVARYYTPDGHYIEHVGLKPDVFVAEPPGVSPSDDPALDPQLKAAIGVLERMMPQSTGR